LFYVAFELIPGLSVAEEIAGCLVVLVSARVTWRLIRRVLPKQVFVAVGTRLYRQQPWRLLGAIAVTAAAGTYGYRLDATWPARGPEYLLNCLGVGMLSAAVGGGLWIAVRFVETLAGSLVEYAETFVHPRAVLVDNHIAMLGELDRLNEGPGRDPAARRKLIEQLEMSARCIERGLRRRLQCGDPATDRWVRNRTAQMAAAMRALKVDVVTQDTDVAAKLTGPLTTTLRCALSQEWGQVPVQEVIREPARAFIPRILTTIVLVGLPLLLIVPGARHSDNKKDSIKIEAQAAGNEKGSNLQEAISEMLKDWDTTMEPVLALLASTALLLSRLDAITNWISRRPGAPQPLHT
jgi:hypothetical protein